MRRSRKFLLGALVAALAAGGTAAVKTSRGNGKKGPASVVVARGNLVDKALAVGTIEPEVEISIKSRVSGVVKQRFVNPGDPSWREPRSSRSSRTPPRSSSPTPGGRW